MTTIRVRGGVAAPAKGPKYSRVNRASNGTSPGRGGFEFPPTLLPVRMAFAPGSRTGRPFAAARAGHGALWPRLTRPTPMGRASGPGEEFILPEGKAFRTSLPLG